MSFVVQDSVHSLRALNSYFTHTVLEKLFHYSAAALLAMQSAVLATAIPSVRLLVCLSVTRWYCTQTNKDRITQSSL